LVQKCILFIEQVVKPLQDTQIAPWKTLK